MFTHLCAIYMYYIWIYICIYIWIFIKVCIDDSYILRGLKDSIKDNVRFYSYIYYLVVFLCKPLAFPFTSKHMLRHFSIAMQEELLTYIFVHIAWTLSSCEWRHAGFLYRIFRNERNNFLFFQSGPPLARSI